MHPITRCPACNTLFRLVPDQLRMAKGWVRCGECGEVFDATFHALKTSLPQNVQAAASAKTENPTANLPDITNATTNEPDPKSTQAPQLTDPLPVTPPIAEIAEPENARPEANLALELLAIEPGEQRHGSPPDISRVSFLQDSQNTLSPGPTWARAGLILMSLILSLGLLLQVLRQERNLLHTLEPRLKPWLAALCVPLKCTLTPLRRIESIVVESATFMQVADSFRLNVTLKNTSNLNLAAPAVELTLTDAFNQPVLRRVFLPTELNLPTQGLAAQTEWARSVVMAIATTQLHDPIAGYQLLAFYP